MRILVEATELATSEKAGVYTARLGLLTGLLEHLEAEDELTLTCLPVGELPELPAPPLGATQTFIRGPFRGNYFPNRITSARSLGWPWLAAAGIAACGVAESIGRRWTRELQTTRFTRRVLRGGPVDVFLSSEMDYYRFPTGVTAAFLHDLLPALRPEWFTSANRRNYLRKLRHVERDCDIVLTNSACTRRDAITHLGVDPNRYFVTPLAPRPHFHATGPGERWDDLDKRWGLTGRRVVLHVGTLEPRKNVLQLIDAVEQLRRDRRFDDVCLVLCGGVGWNCSDLLARAADLERRGKLIRTGFVDDETLSRLYRRCDVCACVSLYEGFGLPMLEAMASGAPVICSSAGALPEVVGTAARMVDPQSADSISAAIRELLDDAWMRAELSQAGRRRAAEFSWSATGRRTLDIFRWAAGAGPKPDNCVAEFETVELPDRTLRRAS